MGRIPDGQQIADQNEAFRIAEAITTPDNSRTREAAQVSVASLPANHAQLRKLCHTVATSGPKNWPDGILIELQHELRAALAGKAGA